MGHVFRILACITHRHVLSSETGDPKMEKQLLALTASRRFDLFDGECLEFWQRSAFDLRATGCSMLINQFVYNCLDILLLYTN